MSSPNQTPHPPKRPSSVTILVVVVLIFTSQNILRLEAALRTQQFLVSLPLQVPVAYLVGTGGAWAVIGLFTAAGLFAMRRWAFVILPYVVGSYTAFYWFDRLVISNRFIITTRWPFSLGMTVLLLAFTYWTWRKSRFPASGA